VFSAANDVRTCDRRRTIIAFSSVRVINNAIKHFSRPGPLHFYLDSVTFHISYLNVSTFRQVHWVLGLFFTEKSLATFLSKLHFYEKLFSGKLLLSEV
jgi:hypothetical protein